MLWLNGSAAECKVTLPPNEWVQRGAVVLSTDAGNPVGLEVEAGGSITLAPRSLVLLEQT
jgi:glycogen operon protein